MYHQALIFGASGISGWAVTRAAVLSKPPFAFDKVIGLTNRTLSIKDSSLPEDPRLELKSGLDLSLGVSAVVDVLRTINGIENTTHVYFTGEWHLTPATSSKLAEPWSPKAYIHGAFGETNSDARTRINVEILRNAVLAVETLSPALRFWTLQSGAKWYGTEFSHILKPKTPFKGTDPRIPSPYADHCFYYPQEGLLQNLSQGKGWDFANIIPDSIIGFVPNGNPMTIAHPIGLYLALWKSFGGSKEVAFPGTPTSYRTLHADSAQDLLGDFTIFLSMQGDKVAGQSFNIADNDSVTWQSTWPGICSYFGLHGTDPVEDSALPQGEKWVMDLKPQWEQWERQHSLKKGTVANAPWDFFTLIVGYYSEIDRNLDISKARGLGWDRSYDAVQSYHETFGRLQLAKLLP